MILGVRNALRSIGNKYVTCKKGEAQTTAPLMAYLSEEQPDALLQCDRQSVDINSSQIDPGLEAAARKQQMASGGAKPQFVIGISLVHYY